MELCNSSYYQRGIKRGPNRCCSLSKTVTWVEQSIPLQEWGQRPAIPRLEEFGVGAKLIAHMVQSVQARIVQRYRVIHSKIIVIM
jgi:hypothetical protein